jgi:uncharacterized membrane protein YczE
MMLKRLFILRWHGWRQFIRDFVVIQIGFLLFGISIAMMVKANLGTTPWVVLEVALTKYLPITLGQATIVVAMLIVLVDLTLGQPLGWGTFANMLSIGLWVDWVMPFVPAITSALWLQLVFLLVSTLVMGFATAIYVGVNAGAGPRDSLMLAISRRAKVSVRVARMVIEVTVVAIGWALGGPLGVGTVLFALAIGPAVQFAFRLLRVKPIQPTPIDEP